MWLPNQRWADLGRSGRKDTCPPRNRKFGIGNDNKQTARPRATFTLFKQKDSIVKMFHVPPLQGYKAFSRPGFEVRCYRQKCGL